MRSLIVVALVLAGCVGDAAPSPSSGGTSPDLGGTWQLEQGAMKGEPIPIVEDHPITVIVEPSRLTGTAGCNQYGVEMTPTANGVRLSEVGMTAMACMPDAVMDSEAAYVAALAGVTQIRRDGDALVLRGEGVELRFGRLPDPPTGELVGTEWVLETLLNGEVASAAVGDLATLEIREDGSFSGETGCRTFSGRWIERGHEILATEMGMDQTECPPALQPQDSHVVAVIGDGFVPTIDGELLTLTDPGGVGLVYRLSE